MGDAGWAADGAEPTIHQWTDTYTQMVGQDALLLCRAGGNHETFWYFEPMMAPDRRKPLDLKSEKYQVNTYFNKRLLYLFSLNEEYNFR